MMLSLGRRRRVDVPSARMANRIGKDFILEIEMEIMEDKNVCRYRIETLDKMGAMFARICGRWKGIGSSRFRVRIRYRKERERERARERKRERDK